MQVIFTSSLLRPWANPWAFPYGTGGTVSDFEPGYLTSKLACINIQ